MQTRRSWLQASIVLGAGTLTACTLPSKDPSPSAGTWRQQLQDIEARSGGRLGVSVQRADGTRVLHHRGDERFLLCSTFKLLLAAQMLQLAEQGQVSLSTFVPYTRADLLEYAPVTERHVAQGGMTVKELCAAALLLSDNTAANVLMQLQGGPQGLTQWLRGQGDAVTRLDRWEPALNDVVPGQIDDTTTPWAMAATVQGLLQAGAGAPLQATSRALLREWMVNSPTGAKRLRAGMPQSWTVGDKTGTGDAGTVSDVCSVWLGGPAPAFTVAAYLTEAQGLGRPAQQQVLADVGRVVGAWWNAQHS